MTNRDAEDFILSQVRLRVDADLTENVSAVVQLINERLWGAEDEERQRQIAGVTGGLFGGSARPINLGEDDLTGDSMYPSDTEIMLDLAYFTMKEMLYEPLTMTIGRQPLRFGNALIIGDPDPAVPIYAPSLVAGALGGAYIMGGDGYVTDGGLRYIADDLSKQKGFDAIRATLDYSPLVVDVVYSKVREGFIEVADDIDVMGVNMAYQLDDTTLLEGYGWYKSQDMAPMLDLTGFSGLTPNDVERDDTDDEVFTVGVRAETAVTDQISLFGEYAYQFGDAINVVNPLAPGGLDPLDMHADRSAFAVQVGGSYQFDDDNNSMVSASYTYLSSENDLEDDKWQQWDPMFEDQRAGELANLFINTGAQVIKASASTMPREDLTAILDVYWYRATGTPIIQTYLEGANPGSAYIAYATGPLSDQWYWVDRDEKDLAWEADLSLVYDYTEDVQMGLVSAWFIPGDFFAGQNDETAYQVRTYASVDF
jgi:hypothetical protein